MDCRTLGWRAPVRLAPPDHERELVKGRGDGHSGKCIVPEFVVSSLQVLDEGMAFDDHAGSPVLFEAPHGAKPGLQASVVSFDPIVGILSGVVKCGRQEFRNDSDQGVGSIGGDFSRLAVGGDRTGKERCRSLQVTLLGQEHVDDLSVLVDCLVDVPPRPGAVLGFETTDLDDVMAQDESIAEPLDADRAAYIDSVLADGT
jgi:hypothetical protein